MSNDKKKNVRYLGKIKGVQGTHGVFYKLDIDNPYPKNKEGVANNYYKGNLIWVDAETGKQYIVKQATLKGVSEAAKASGYTNSICIDLDSEYDVIKPQD